VHPYYCFLWSDLPPTFFGAVLTTSSKAQQISHESQIAVFSSLLTLEANRPVNAGYFMFIAYKSKTVTTSDGFKSDNAKTREPEYFGRVELSMFNCDPLTVTFPHIPWYRPKLESNGAVLSGTSYCLCMRPYRSDCVILL
jgi:hypothetical protein